MEILFKESTDDIVGEFLDKGFERYAEQHGIECGYCEFVVQATENGDLIGVLTGNSYYKEVHIHDLIVAEEHRGKGVGSRLIAAAEDHYSGRGFENMNLTTYAFQAPDFYKKCGFAVEYVRKSRSDPQLDKYCLVKYF